jgi:hypothetical protein
MFDAALRRRLRKKLGSRYVRRSGTKSRRASQMKPRARLAQLVVEWAEEQKRAAARPAR